MLANAETETPSFTSLGLHETLLSAINRCGFVTPTPVQQQAIPQILERKDLLVSAETGSGKTAAFLLPTLQRLVSERTSLFGTRALILAPTRELARQTFSQCQLLAEFTQLTTGLVTGGEDFKKQQGLLRRNAEIIVATPGRLLELMQQNAVDFSHLQLLILDEADRMLDMGFSDDVLNIANNSNPERQTLLFSATLSHFGVIKIADRLLKNHKTIALNNLHDGHSNISQQIILADDFEHKRKLLTWLLGNETYDKALIFNKTRAKAEEIRAFLQAGQFRVGLLHGEMEQKDRKRAMELFRDGIIKIMVSTDLAARGLDVKGINLVVNFDVPRNGIDYIHRIGRTGRADELGLTIALVQSTEWNLMSSIARYLRQQFERRKIDGLEGRYQGPQKIKSSGKAVGSKNKPEPKKTDTKKVKIRARDKKNIGKRRTPSNKTSSQDH